ncbi:MAG: beta-ketoacyl-[acyl-carrier-protein] synthase family protein [Ruminococcus sp.]|nr:beta-ketoacyl-[acyl-carrier-protein] synthase family protein [Ruminococcus sp.]
MNRRRIAVVGLGVISQAGCNKEEFFENILSGQKHETEFIPERITQSYCRKYDMIDRNILQTLEKERLTKNERNTLGLCAKLAVLSADEALKDSGIIIDEINAELVSVLIGSAYGENYSYEKFTSSDARVYSNTDISSSVARHIGAAGEIFTNINACATGNTSIAYGCELIYNKRADIVVAGASDVYSELLYGGFSRIKVLSGNVQKPFDVDRDGIILSEGAGTIILEDYDHAVKRGAYIYCEVLGTGMSNDAYHMVAPDPTAKGAVSAIMNALEDSGCSAGDIDYISLHGTGTQANDICESLALKKTFGDYAGRIYASSLKGLLGHSLGTASMLSSVSCVMSIEKGMIPFTANTENPISECPVKLVINESVKKDLNIVMNNAFAFGGSNCIIIFGKCRN